MISRTSSLGVAICACVTIAACGAPGRPPQSPTNDTPAPVTNTGDGKMLGTGPNAAQTPEGPKLDSKEASDPPAAPK